MTTLLRHCEICDGVGSRGSPGTTNMMYLGGIAICSPCVKAAIKTYMNSLEGGVPDEG